MINDFKKIGQLILEKDGYFDEQNEIEKRKIFLNHFTLIPRKNYKNKSEETERALVLNFDTEKGEFKFELGDEIDPLNREAFFAFALMGNGKKQFATTNKMSDFYDTFFSDSLDLIKSKRSVRWFNENVATIYDQFLINVYKQFYQDNGFIKTDLLEENQKIVYERIVEKIENDIQEQEKELENKDLSSADKKKVERKIKELKKLTKTELINLFINKHLFSRDSKSSDIFPTICLVKINGKMFHEIESIKDSYINFCYYTIFERDFQEKSNDNKCCSICSGTHNVLGKVSFPYTAFYGTTNQLNFENLKNGNAYKSFAICQECFKETVIGMKYVENELKDKMFDIDVMLIPKYTEGSVVTKREKRILDIFNQDNKNTQEEFDSTRDMLRQANKQNYFFDLMFFEKNKAQFDVIKLISNINYQSLLKKMKLFEDLSNEYKLSLINQQLNWIIIYYSLFPSFQSHPKIDAKLYRKELLNLIEKFINSQPINYKSIIKLFVDIYAKRFHRDRVDELSPFKMILILKIFNTIKPMSGVNEMEGNAVTSVQNEKYVDFFEAHKEIYENNYFRQGLFLLGTIINKIIYAQKGKSSTFMKKINLKGVPTRRVTSLILDVQEYAGIYKVFEETGLWGNIMDRLQNIENSKMTPEEVVFYILSGSSYAKYDALISNINKKSGDDNDSN